MDRSRAVLLAISLVFTLAACGAGTNNAKRGDYHGEYVHKNSSPGCAPGVLAHSCGGGYGP